MTKINLNELPKKELVSGFDAKFVHTDNMTLSYVVVKAGSTLPEHTHPHVQVTSVVSGSFELIFPDRVVTLNEGDVQVIKSNEPHGGKAITDCYLIDVFNPVREDFKEISDELYHS